MNNDKILDSITYLNFINQINSLSNELLYSQNGFCFLKSHQAVKAKEFILDKFYFEANKIKNSLNFSDTSNYIDLKAKDFVAIVEKHYNNELLNWAQDVFERLGENYLFELSLDKTKAKDIYSSLMNLILWLSNIKKLNKTKVLQIQTQYKKRFEQTLNSSDLDFLSTINEIKTKPSDFMKIWNLISKNFENFNQQDLHNANIELSDIDIKYFQNIKNKLKTYKREEILDEISLLNSAFNYFKITNDSEKYQLIKMYNNDVALFVEKNKAIEEADKIKLIKRRIMLFKDGKSKDSQYFTSQFSHSLSG